jgi:hypothetical protein
MWDVVSCTRRDNNMNFDNRYLLVLEEERTEKQASRVCSNRWGIVGSWEGA